MRKYKNFLKGRRTYLFFGSTGVLSLTLLIWCHYVPGLLPDEVQGYLVQAVGFSLAGLGLRAITTTPPGRAGE